MLSMNGKIEGKINKYNEVYTNYVNDFVPNS
jgi:hypothetical protein